MLLVLVNLHCHSYDFIAQVDPGRQEFLLAYMESQHSFFHVRQGDRDMINTDIICFISSSKNILKLIRIISNSILSYPTSSKMYGGQNCGRMIT